MTLKSILDTFRRTLLVFFGSASFFSMSIFSSFPPEESLDVVDGLEFCVMNKTIVVYKTLVFAGQLCAFL